MQYICHRILSRSKTFGYPQKHLAAQSLPGNQQIMFHLHPLLVLFLLLGTVTAAFDFAENTAERMRRPLCGEQCKFRFCKFKPGFELAPVGRTLLLRDPGIASIPFVCHPDFTLGNILNTAESLVCFPGTTRPPVRISRYLTPCIRPNVSREYFQIKEINNFPPLPGKYGMSRLKTKTKQENCINDLCIKIPITKYQIIGTGRGNPTRIVETNNPDDCVSFTTNRALLLIELSWNTGDDMDLKVIEPNGDIISFRRTSSSSGGKLIRDSNVGTCGNRELGREQIRWTCNSRPKKGFYKVQVRQWNRCRGDDRITKWSLSIIVGSKLKFNLMGIANSNSRDALIYTTRIRFRGPIVCDDCDCP